VTWPGKPANYDNNCIQCLSGFCNEWTKYSHLATNSVTANAGLSPGDFVQAGTLLGYEGSVGTSNQHLHWEVARLDPSDLFQNVPGGDANGWPHDWSNGGWVGSPNLLPHLCGVPGYLDKNEFHTAEGCPDTANAPMGKGSGDVAANVRWTWQGQTVSATALVSFVGPDARNRITLSGFALDRPVSLEGTTTVLNTARLIRPVVFTLGRDGTARIPADQLIFTFDLSRELWTSSPHSASTGPLRGGHVNVGYSDGALRFSLDATPLGTIAGEAKPR
jgi:hypothetical protein